MTTVLAEAIEQTKLDLAKGNHSPTKAMQVVAQRGVRLAGKRNDIDSGALSVGRKVASGQKLNDNSVEHMASYHAALDSDPENDEGDPTCIEHMLWGGAPGSNWSSARMAAVNIAQLGQSDAPSMLMLDQEGKGVSLEVFVRDGMGEKFDREPDAEGLIWAPILRSGMLACRPDPTAANGRKHEPLVFVPGKASDPRKEIGLENLVEAYYDGAIQHVTIPTSHENGVLDNTGFIKGLKIVDSEKRPGEKVLMGAHDFRDPKVREKVELGTIANRSCGIQYDYVNTETGKSYPQALDHVALTNKPWVTGMEAYGESNFSEDREVVPMLLSEPTNLAVADPSTQPFDSSPTRFDDKQWRRSCLVDLGEGDDPKTRFTMPIREPDGTLNANAVREAAEKVSPLKGLSLSQKKAAARSLIAAHAKIGEQPPKSLLNVVTASTNLSQAEREALLLADVKWGSGELSMNDMLSQVVGHLDEMRGDEYGGPYFSVEDVVGNPDPKALVRCDYGDPDGAMDAWVIPLEVDGDKVSLSDFSEWTPVQREWVTDEDADGDKSEVASLLGGQTVLSDDAKGWILLATLSAKERKALSASDFVFPDTREYPIQDLAHAKDALARGAENETGARLRKIRNAVYRRYPDLKNDKTNLSLFSSDPLKGGAVKPTTQEVLERLNLSAEQREALSPIIARQQELEGKLALSESEARKTRVTSRVTELQGLGFPAGFCKRYEEIALGDDGDVAATLNLSENGQQTGNKDYSATDIAESLISCLPKDETGKLALSEHGNLLASPISERPPADAADQRAVEAKQNGKTVKTAEEWLSDAEKVAPGVTQSLNLTDNTQKGA